jgi:hypothetical protein
MVDHLMNSTRRVLILAPHTDDAELEDAGIPPVYSPFSQRNYPQLFGEFIGNLSAVDVLMNCGYLGTRRLLCLESDPD